MDFGQLFSRAWNICWNNKWLFLLGFLAALTAGNSSSNVNYQFGAEDFPLGPNGQLPPGFEQNIERAIEAALPIVIGLTCFALLLGIAFWLLRLTAQAGLIRAAADADAGQKISLGKAFSDGFRYLPRFIALNLLFFVPLFVLVFVSVIVFAVSFSASLVALLAGNSVDTNAFGGVLGIVGLCACLLLCLTIPLGILIAILQPYAQRGVVLEELGVFASVGRAWRVLTGNLANSILLLLLYIVIGIAVAVVVGIVLFPIGVLLALPSLSGIFLTGSLDVAGLIITFVGFLIIGFIGALVAAIWTTFRSVSFTLAYGEFAQQTPLK